MTDEATRVSRAPEAQALREALEEGGCPCGCSGRKGRVLREIDMPPGVAVWMRRRGMAAVPKDLLEDIRRALAASPEDERRETRWGPEDCNSGNGIDTCPIHAGGAPGEREGGRPSCPEHGSDAVVPWWRSEHGYHWRCKAGGITDEDVGWECGNVLGGTTKEVYDAHHARAPQEEDTDGPD